MKRVLLTVASLLLLFMATAVSADDAGNVRNEWFSISLPPGFSAFATQQQTVKSADGGEIETTNWVSKAPTGEAVVVTVSKMPGKILDPEKMMDSTRDSMLASLNAKLETETKKLDADMPATRLLFRSQTASPAFLTSRLVVNDDLLYQLLYVGRSEEQRAGAAVSRIFDSFEVIAPEPEAEAETETASVQ